MTSKRKLKQLPDEAIVEGWDDPRMPTISGLRRRGYPAAAIRHFCEEVGTSRSDGIVDVAMLESAVRDELNRCTPSDVSCGSEVGTYQSHRAARTASSKPPGDPSLVIGS